MNQQSRKSKNCVIFRDANSEPLRQVASVKFFSIPAIRIEPPKKRISIPNSSFDFGLVTSQNALRFVRKIPKIRKKWIFIGKASARATRRDFAEIVKFQILSSSNSEGIRKFFTSLANRNPNPKIFFPRSKIADPELIRAMRKAGCRVVVRHTYDTKLMPIKNKLRALLRRKKLDAFFFTSPSTFRTVRRSLSSSLRKELKKSGVQFVAIGPTTAAEMRKYGWQPRIAKKPNLQSMVDTLK